CFALALVAPLGAEQRDRRHIGGPLQRRRPLPQSAQEPLATKVYLLLLQSARRLGVAVVEEGAAALRLVGLADGGRGPAERVQAAQETAVGLVRPRHRAVALPAVAAQRVQP